jgi:hypothetical protein
LPPLKNTWKKFRSGVANAFKIEADQPFTPTERQTEIVTKLADWVVRRKLTLPAVMALESVTPLNFLGSQAMVFFQPFATVFLNPADYKELLQMLEYRDCIQYVIRTIESKEDARKQNLEAKNNANSAAKESKDV